MAKIRVYELARKLNMTNKALLDKIQETDIPVKSHMSTLEDEHVALIRASILGRKAEFVEETHVQPAVIRRRRKEPALPKDVEAGLEPVAVEPVIASEEFFDIVEPPETATEAASLSPDSKVLVELDPIVATPVLKPAGEQQPRGAEPSESEAEEITAIGQECESPDMTSKSMEPPPPSLDEPPDLQTIPQLAEEPLPETSQAGRLSESIGVIESPTVSTPPATPAPAEKPAVIPDKPDEKVKPDEQEQTDSDRKAAPQPTVTAQPAISRSSRSQRRKRGRKDMPARIIKPAPAVLPASVTVPPATTSELPPTATPASTPSPRSAEADTADENRARLKKKKKRDLVTPPPQEDKKAGKKKVPFRKKEVVDVSGLYSDKNRNRRLRKSGRSKAQPVLQKPIITTAKAIKRRLKIDDTIILAELAKRLGIKAADIIRKLMDSGVMATMNQVLDFETAVLVAAEFDYELERAAFEEESILKPQSELETDPSQLIQRPPVVTIMGHVDHGKTSLLDVIRKSRITEDEAGGITQHIGAYHVETARGRVVFLDTPGHEAFTAMRSRGASVTDLVILVVAADDGVMPQTHEAINHAKAAGVPMIVAINKMDKSGADPEKVQRELADAGLIPEDWGGDTIFVKVSAKARQGIDELLEMILLQAEVLELKANPDKMATGHVVEAKLDSGRGPVATVLIEDGTLHTGDAVVCGIHYGKIRALLNDRGQPVDSAGPAMPVEVIGLSGVPLAGDELVALADEKDARQVSSHRVQKQRMRDLAKTNRLSLENLFDQIQEGHLKTLNLLIKADVHGSIEALRDSLLKLANDEVSINVVHAATGTITESDVSLAAVSDAIVIGFNVRPSTKVQALANEEQVDIRFYDIIYNAIQDVKNAIVGLMASTFETRILGHAEVREVFHVPKIGTIAGCYVTDGKIQRGRQSRLLREGVVCYDGKIGSLRRFKDDVKEVLTGYECGIGIENYQDIKVGDVVECYFMEELKPELQP